MRFRWCVIQSLIDGDLLRLGFINLIDEFVFLAFVGILQQNVFQLVANIVINTFYQFLLIEKVKELIWVFLPFFAVFFLWVRRIALVVVRLSTFVFATVLIRVFFELMI